MCFVVTEGLEDAPRFFAETLEDAARYIARRWSGLEITNYIISIHEDNGEEELYCYNPVEVYCLCQSLGLL